MTERPRAGLVWRLYAVGFVQFLLVVLSALMIGFVMTRSLDRWDMQSLTARLKPLGNDRVALARSLQDLRTHDKLSVSLYNEHEQLLVSNVVPALLPPRLGDNGPPPGGPPPFATPHFKPEDGPPRFNGPDGPHFGSPDGPPDTFARFELNGHNCLIVVRFEHHKPSPVPIVLTMLSGILVLGMGAFLTARWIAQPLSQLSRAAILLGQGDLRARSELTRSDEVGDVARAFDEMAERIQRLLKNEKELLANVAHELRTPLARIRVALEIASEGDAATVRSSLAEIAVDLAELEALINDVLTAARFELVDGLARSAGFALRLEEIAPQMIAERSAERFRSNHPDRPFSAEFSSISGVIDADPVLLRRVVDNLLENAHKYSPEPDSRIMLQVSEVGERACFSVTDHGMGIPSEDLPRVFTAFFRGERSRSRGTGGVGLGLTLAKRIVEAHGGSIEVESSLGQGATFRAWLPVRAGTPPASA